STTTPHSLPFFFHYNVNHQDLHSFPTRRSSDLRSVFEGIKTAIVADRYAYFKDFLDNFYNVDKLGGTRISDQAWQASFDVVEVVDRKSTRLNSSHVAISYAVFCLKKKKEIEQRK